MVVNGSSLLVTKCTRLESTQMDLSFYTKGFIVTVLAEHVSNLYAFDPDASKKWVNSWGQLPMINNTITRRYLCVSAVVEVRQYAINKARITTTRRRTRQR